MGVNTIFPKTGTTSTDRLGSHDIWGDCPWDDITNPRSGVNGIAFFDDFDDYPLSPTLTTQIASGKYKVFGDTGNTITRAFTNTGGAANATQIVPGGFQQFAIDTDNDEVALCHAYPCLMMTGASSNTGKLWFEACYMQNGGVSSGTGSVQGDAIPTNCASVFLGLCNVGGITLSTSVPLNDGDPISNTVYGLGFRIAEDGLGVIDTVVTDGSTSFTNIGATEGGTLTAWNPIKLGFVYDPTQGANCITFYVNNVAAKTHYSATTLAALTNLPANGLGAIYAATADSAGTVFKGCLKWWRMAQIVP